MINFIFLMVAVFVLASCFQRTVYDEYAHTPIAGWEKNDTLSFEIPPILTTGYYQENLGLRITGAYPFTGLTLHASLFSSFTNGGHSSADEASQVISSNWRYHR